MRKGRYKTLNQIAIVTDSNSGITQEQAKELGVFVVPMPFDINGQILKILHWEKKNFMKN